MPLVVPGINNNSADGKTEEWANKLVGKKLHDEETNETVSGTQSLTFNLVFFRRLTCCQTFCKRDLPEQTRVIEPGMMVTKDFKPDRLNVHLKEDGTVSHVAHG